ncbi:PP2C family protein-serine/threonine phosphatase [Aeriscardovia aeriphila]|uniref:Protein phosphatase n=1 Tax=Aeriscardovia aeriphila TaxID=218139 RepID=A0A261FBF6_9BIFI|nr:hypothetical protein [Aeriscardovia aeriphila]NYI25548.1 serine/threonine protein phosphatase PrpC [Aeriscardovia aeriphila]OZG56303.1 protein phosphatase [Aeriscardovia aeriphila]
MAVSISSAAFSDIGLVRRDNQDSYVSQDGLYLVADGMGGGVDGREASAVIIAEFAKLAHVSIRSRAMIEDCIQQAQARVAAMAHDGRMAGSTLTGIILKDISGEDPDNCWYVVNIGDSRTYHLSELQVEQVVAPRNFLQRALHRKETPDITDATSSTPRYSIPTLDAPHLTLEGASSPTHPTHTEASSYDEVPAPASSDQTMVLPRIRNLTREDVTPGMALTAQGETDNGNLKLDVEVSEQRKATWDVHSFVQVTHDHSKRQEVIDAGEMDEESAKRSIPRNIITQAVGSPDGVSADYFRAGLYGRFVMCSDGIYSEIEPTKFVELACAQQDARTVAQNLVNAALDAGGKDNATVIVVDCLDSAVHQWRSVRLAENEDIETMNDSTLITLRTAVKSSSAARNGAAHQAQ